MRPPKLTGIYNADRWGYGVGAGLEYGITPNWSVKIEYTHYAFDRSTSPLENTWDPIALSLRVDTVKAGANDRFG